jgi:site-specific recombinase XerC
MQVAGGQDEGTGFLGQLRQEILLHKGQRATFILSKMAFVALLFALGAIQVDGMESRWLLYALPFVALAFDVYISAEDFKVKRVGAFLRAYVGVSRSEHDWERYVSRHRAQGMLATTFAVTVIVALGAGGVLWAQVSDAGLVAVPLSSWGVWGTWLALVAALLAGAYVYHRQLIVQLPQAHLQPAQSTALLEAPDKSTLAGLRDRAIIALLLNTGLEADELVAMRLGDLTETEDGRPAVRGQPRRGEQGRVVPFREPYVAAFALKEWVKQAEITGGPIFRGVDDGAASARGIAPGAVDAILRRYPVVIDGAIQTVDAAQLRRAYARYLFEDGLDLQTIRQRLGCKRVEDVLGFSGPTATRLGLES